MCEYSLRRVFQQWRIWIRPILIVLYILFVLIILPLLIVNSVKDGFTKKDQLILIGGLFVLTSLPISFWHITQHVIHFTKPVLQKHIVRILWMVPIYALNAWLSLLFPAHSIYMDSIRECYEAYVIYNFMVYLLNYLNLEMDLEANLEFKPQVNHIFPLCFMTPWTMGREFVHNCKHGILQYTVVRPITTFISVICEINGVYGEGNFRGNVAFPYIIAANNLSQFTAMYCLVLFYKANYAELKPMKPLPKFLCIKAVVFFSFFQGVIINILVYFGYIKDIFGDDSKSDYNENLAAKLQNFLICIEMFIAAIGHHYSFPHHPFHINIPHYGPHNSWYNAFLTMLDMSDVQQDVTEHIGIVGSSLSRRFRGRSVYQMARGTESEYLISASSSSQNQSDNHGTATGLYQSGGDQNYSNSNQVLDKSLVIGNYSKQTSKNDHENILTAGSNSSKNYGTMPSKPFVHQHNDGINIINRNKKEYSPKHGIPKADNLMHYNDLTTAAAAATSNAESKKSEKNHRNSEKSEVTTTSSSSSMSRTNDNRTDCSNYNMKKSDSNESDWLSTPTDIDVLGIDVRGVENDRINYQQNPKL